MATLVAWKPAASPTAKRQLPLPLGEPPAADSETPLPGDATPVPAPPETYVDAALIELVRSLHSYGGMEPRTPVTKLVIVGASGYEQELAAALPARVNVPCSV